MIAAVDVDYREQFAAAAGLLFAGWADATSTAEVTVAVADPAPYVPGEFWKRELPCVLKVLDVLPEHPAIVVIDGYVWLDASGRPGLGSHLYHALGGTVAVVGVAKTPFLGASHALSVQRGQAVRPLYVTAQGMSVTEAAEAVRRMHGPFRIPTLLKRVDRLCREPSHARTR
jgi:deoxyribonuclease V